MEGDCVTGREKGKGATEKCQSKVCRHGIKHKASSLGQLEAAGQHKCQRGLRGRWVAIRCAAKC